MKLVIFIPLLCILNVHVVSFSLTLFSRAIQCSSKFSFKNTLQFDFVWCTALGPAGTLLPQSTFRHLKCTRSTNVLVFSKHMNLLLNFNLWNSNKSYYSRFIHFCELHGCHSRFKSESYEMKWPQTSDVPNSRTSMNLQCLQWGIMYLCTVRFYVAYHIYFYVFNFNCMYAPLPCTAKWISCNLGFLMQIKFGFNSMY